MHPGREILAVTMRYQVVFWAAELIYQFSPRCMECRRGLAMKILSVRPTVCLSVRPSVTRVNCDETVERSVQIYIPYERSFSVVF